MQEIDINYLETIKVILTIIFPHENKHWWCKIEASQKGCCILTGFPRKPVIFRYKPVISAHPGSSYRPVMETVPRERAWLCLDHTWDICGCGNPKIMGVVLEFWTAIIYDEKWETTLFPVGLWLTFRYFYQSLNFSLLSLFIYMQTKISVQINK